MVTKIIKNINKLKKYSMAAGLAVKEEKSALYPLSRMDYVIAFLCFLTGLLIYIRTLAPGVLWGDSVEFQTLSSTLGITHPPGYPVYLLIGKFFTLLPINDIAYRVNLLSAVFAATTLALLYLIGRMLIGWRVPVLACCLALGINSMFWVHAVIAELYDGAAMLVAAELLLLLCWRQNGKRQYLFMAGLIGGLSLGIHSTVALMAPAVLVYLALNTRLKRDWLGAVGGAILGVVLYFGAFMLIDAVNAPSGYYNSVVRPSMSVWNMSPTDFDNPLERMAFELKAQQFTPLMFQQPFSHTWENAKNYFAGTGWIQWTFLAFGLLYLFIRRWREGILVLFTWLGMAIFIFNYEIYDINTFYVPTYVPLFLAMVCCGVGAIFELLAWCVSRVPKLSAKQSVVANGIGLLLVVYYFIPFPAYVMDSIKMGKLSIPDQPVFENEQKHREVQMTFNNIEDNAVVLTHWDTLYLDYYVTHVEQGRTGIVFIQIDPQAQAGERYIAASLSTYIDSNIDERPFYVMYYAPELVSDYKLSRVGITTVYRMQRKDNQ